MRTILMVLAFLTSCAANSRNLLLQKELNDYVADKDAAIGIAVIIDGKDTVAVNSPMRDRFAVCDTVEISMNGLLAYAVQQSDNNASMTRFHVR